MMYQQKLLFIRAKVGGFPINKASADDGAAVNLMPHTLLNKIGNIDTDLRPQNMALSNYEGKTRHILGVIQVNLSVGSTTRQTLFVVIPYKENYNMLLGREWIHRIWVIPSMLRQRVPSVHTKGFFLKMSVSLPVEKDVLGDNLLARIFYFLKIQAKG